jgi:hypothetical protein
MFYYIYLLITREKEDTNVRLRLQRLRNRRSAKAKNVDSAAIMATINEESDYSANIERPTSPELDELAILEAEFVDFVLPWLKLVPPRTEKKRIDYKVI